MDQKKLEGFKKRLETRQQDLSRTVNRTQKDGRSADEDTARGNLQHQLDRVGAVVSKLEWLLAHVHQLPAAEPSYGAGLGQDR